MNTPVNTLLIDDEISAIIALRGMLLNHCPQINIQGEAGNIDEAVSKTIDLKPDLVFLDIEMPPQGNAFDYLQAVHGQHNFGVVFTTAYPEYALRAISAAQPWGYLIKPFSISSLMDVVEIAVKKTSERKILQKTTPGMDSILILDMHKRYHVVKPEEILCCQSDGATVDLFLEKSGQIKRITCNKTLKELETELTAFDFCRTHHSYLVNLRHIERMERTGRNGTLFLKKDLQVSVSVQKMADFEARFEQFLKK